MLAPMLEAPYGVYAVDMDQRIVFWNSAAERILGHERENVLGRHTVLTHIRNARERLNAKNRTEAILIALRRGLL